MVNDVREFKRLLEEIRWLDADLYGKDFLLTWEQSSKEVQQVLYTAEALRWLYENNISTKCFESGLAVLQAGDKLTSLSSPWAAGNRFSFGLAANLLGLTLHHQETSAADIRDLCLSFLTGVEIVGIQDIASGPAALPAVEDREETGTPPRKPGIINLHSHRDYPAQALADMLLLKHHFFSLERLAGKKIALLWDFSASPLAPPSVPQGITALVTRFGMDVSLACPEGYDLNPQVIGVAHQHAESSGGRFAVVYSPDQALANADAVYSINWSNSPAKEKVTPLEEWTCSPEKLKLTKDSNAFTMTTHDSANYKTYVIAALMMNNRCKEPAKLLGNLKKRNTRRFVFY